MTTQISRDNIQAATLGGFGGPKISLVQVTNSTYTNLDDTAVDLAGGFVKIIGSGFAAGCQVLVGLTPATSVTFVSETEVRAQLPATAAGSYIVYLVNSDGGTAIRVNGVTFSGTPTWLSNSTLAGEADTLISIQLAATGATTFALAAGSTLPAGVALSSSGLLSGTITGISQETVYNFTINAVDAELQDSPRAFAFTVTSGDVFFAQTTLLLPGSANTFVRDLSTNNATATVFGDTRPSRFNPHLSGWSNFFDGTGDHLTLNSITTSGDFTLEFWAYRTAAVSSFMIPFSAGGNNGWVGWMTNATTFVWDSVVTATVPDTINTWAHYAVVKQGTTARIYVNGVQCGSASTSANLTFSTIGMFGTGSLNYRGFLSNVRLVNGTAVYTAAFTPPTQPLTAISGTSLLTCQSNRFRDASTSNLTITRTGDVAVRSFSPFLEPATTNGSAYFDGTGDYVTMPANNFSTGSNAWTIEGWCYFTNSNQNEVLVNGLGNDKLYVQWLATTLYLGDGSVNNIVVTNAKPINTWVHIAAVKNGSTYTLYINGTNVGFTNNPLTSATITTWQVGGRTSQNISTLGYISNLRVTATAVYTDNFTPPTQPLTAVAGTSLLTLQSNQPHNNNQFLDSSTQNVLITRSGNTAQGSFSPYSPSGWSNYFDGSGDYLTVTANTAFDFGTGDFTVEAWVYLNGGVTEAAFLSGTAIQSTDLVYTENSLRFGRNNLAWDTTINHTLATNVWQHIAFVRESGVAKIYVNGSLIGSAANTNSYGNQNGNILINVSRDLSRQLAGYISNHRIVKGTAVYTANFTPPTQPLTAVPGTSLLTCCDNRFADSSPNRFALTRNGDVKVTNFAPFKAVVQTPVSYSAYFDGTGDYLTVPDNTSLRFGSGDFTLEFWINFSSITGYRTTFDKGYTNAGGLLFQTGNGNGRFIIYAAGTAVITETGTAPANTWIHYALVRNGTALTLYRDGVSSGTATNSTNFNSTSQIGIAATGVGPAGGAIGDYPFNGYLSNIRVVNGTAVYTANFTPPTEPLTAVAGTSLLTCQSATFVDNSTNRFAVTAAGNSQPSMVNPFGFTFANSAGYSAAAHGGSMAFDGTGDDLRFNALDISNINWTIECWVYFNNFSTTNPYVWSWGGGAGNNFGLYRNSTAGKLYFASGISGNTTNLISATTIQAGCWYHTAIVKVGNTCTLYINGINEASGSVSFTDNIEVTVGYERFSSNANNYLNGYVSDLRFMQGTALYTSNFVPPIAPVQPVPGTALLLNGTSAAITDATTKTVVETVGDAKISTAVSKFDGSSMSFDGTGDMLVVNGISSSGAYDRLTVSGVVNTIECWVYLNQFGSPRGCICGSWSSNVGWTYDITTGGDIFIAANGAGFTVSLSTKITTGAWLHLAFVNDGTNIKIYLNGINVGTQAVMGPSSYIGPITIGMRSDSALQFDGYIQDFRITKGVARYTGNFTPPTTALQTK